MVYEIKAILPIEFKIAQLKLVIDLLPNISKHEKCLIYLKKLDKITHSDATTTNEAQKRCVKEKYNMSIKPRVFNKEYLVLVYDQTNNTLGARKFVSMWHKPYIVKHVLGRESYELLDYHGNELKDPINWIYLKRYYS